MAGGTQNKDGEPSAKRKRIPNSLYHNEMFIVMETSPDRMKLKSRKTEPIPEHVIAQGRKSAEKRKSLANFDTTKKKKTASIAQKKHHEEDSKQLKNTPKVALKLPHKKFSAVVKSEQEDVEVEKKVNVSRTKAEEESMHVPAVDTSDSDDSDFDAGSKFKSYDDFCNSFECWKLRKSHNFRVASSETLKNIDGSVDPKCRYRYVVYQCVHYGQPRIRGTGKRPNQTYLPCGCSAMLRLVYNFTEKVLVISKLITTHTGHDGKSYVECNSQNRRQYSRAVKNESPSSPSEVLPENSSSNDINNANSPSSGEEKPGKMTDALYYQQQLQLMAALLPPTMGSPMSTDYSAVFNNYNIQNVANPDTIYRPQPQYSLSAVHNSAFSRVQPLSTSTTPMNDKENSTHVSTNLSMKHDAPECVHPQALSVVENTTWAPREYSDLTVL
ncbi:unnamed protein product [Auanema sp. JU1783]|nr:unnamed protein product [Auanema sp. JU1783]